MSFFHFVKLLLIMFEFFSMYLKHRLTIFENMRVIL